MERDWDQRLGMAMLVGLQVLKGLFLAGACYLSLTLWNLPLAINIYAFSVVAVVYVWETVMAFRD